MESATDGMRALGEAVVFLGYFKDLPDPRQRGKVIIRSRGAAVVPARGAGRGGDIHRHRAVRREEARTAAPVPALFETARPRTIISAISLPRSTPRNSSAASSPGWRR